VEKGAGSEINEGGGFFGQQYVFSNVRVESVRWFVYRDMAMLSKLIRVKVST